MSAWVRLLESTYYQPDGNHKPDGGRHKVPRLMFFLDKTACHQTHRVKYQCRAQNSIQWCLHMSSTRNVYVKSMYYYILTMQCSFLHIVMKCWTRFVLLLRNNSTSVLHTLVAALDLGRLLVSLTGIFYSADYFTWGWVVQRPRQVSFVDAVAGSYFRQDAVLAVQPKMPKHWRQKNCLWFWVFKTQTTSKFRLYNQTV